MPISLDRVYATKKDKDLWIESWSSSID
jgi:hypothetical protein